MGNATGTPEATVITIISELLKVVLEIKGRKKEYNSTIESIEETLKQIEPVVKEIDHLEAKLGQQGEQTKLLLKEIKKGKKLIKNCKSEIDPCCPLFQTKQDGYLQELQKLDESLNTFFHKIVPLQTLREVKKIDHKMDKTHEQMQKIDDKLDQTHDRVNKIDEKVDKIGKLLENRHNNNSPADAGNRSPDQRNQASGAYGRANSKGKDNGGVSSFETSSAAAVVPPTPAKGTESLLNFSHPTGKVAAPPPSPVPWKSRSALEERHRDETKRIDSRAHIVPTPHPSPPPKSPAVVKETEWNVPAQISPIQAMDSPRQQPHVQLEPRHEVKQAPEKVKEVPREPAHSYIPDERSKVVIKGPMVSDDSNKSPSFGKDSPSGRYISHPIKTPKDGSSSSYRSGIYPKSPEIEGISTIQDRAPTSTATYPTSTRPYIPPQSPSSLKVINSKGPSHFNSAQKTDSSYGFSPYPQQASAPSKPQDFVEDPFGYSSPEKGRGTPLTTTTANPTSTRPYIPPQSPSSAKTINSSPSHFNSTLKTDSSYGFTPYSQPASAPPRAQETKTFFAKDQSGYSSPADRRSIQTATSGDNILPRSYPQPRLPKTKEIGYNQGNQVSGQSNPSQNTIGGVASSNYADPENKAIPNKAPEIKKGGEKELRRYKSRDNREYWSSDENDE